jgi:hypothetical protein
VAIVAEKTRIVVSFFDVVRREIQPVCGVLPIGNQGSHIVIHGEVGIAVHLHAHIAQIPATVVVGVTEFGEIEGNRRGDDEEVPHARIIVHVPIGRAREEDAIIPSSSGVVILLRRGGEHHLGGPV